MSGHLEVLDIILRINNRSKVVAHCCCMWHRWLAASCQPGEHMSSFKCSRATEECAAGVIWSHTSFGPPSDLLLTLCRTKRQVLLTTINRETDFAKKPEGYCRVMHILIFQSFQRDVDCPLLILFSWVGELKKWHTWQPMRSLGFR